MFKWHKRQLIHMSFNIDIPLLLFRYFDVSKILIFFRNFVKRPYIYIYFNIGSVSVCWKRKEKHNFKYGFKNFDSIQTNQIFEKFIWNRISFSFIVIYFRSENALKPYNTFYNRLLQYRTPDILSFKV